MKGKRSGGEKIHEGGGGGAGGEKIHDGGRGEISKKRRKKRKGKRRRRRKDTRRRRKRRVKDKRRDRRKDKQRVKRKDKRRGLRAMTAKKRCKKKNKKKKESNKERKRKKKEREREKEVVYTQSTLNRTFDKSKCKFGILRFFLNQNLTFLTNLNFKNYLFIFLLNYFLPRTSKVE